MYNTDVLALVYRYVDIPYMADFPHLSRRCRANYENRPAWERKLHLTWAELKPDGVDRKGRPAYRLRPEQYTIAWRRAYYTQEHRLGYSATIRGTPYVDHFNTVYRALNEICTASAADHTSVFERIITCWETCIDSGYDIFLIIELMLAGRADIIQDLDLEGYETRRRGNAQWNNEPQGFTRLPDIWHPVPDDVLELQWKLLQRELSRVVKADEARQQVENTRKLQKSRNADLHAGTPVTAYIRAPNDDVSLPMEDDEEAERAQLQTAMSSSGLHADPSVANLIDDPYDDQADPRNINVDYADPLCYTYCPGGNSYARRGKTTVAMPHSFVYSLPYLRRYLDAVEPARRGIRYPDHGVSCAYTHRGTWPRYGECLPLLVEAWPDFLSQRGHGVHPEDLTWCIGKQPIVEDWLIPQLLTRGTEAELRAARECLICRVSTRNIVCWAGFILQQLSHVGAQLHMVLRLCGLPPEPYISKICTVILVCLDDDGRQRHSWRVIEGTNEEFEHNLRSVCEHLPEHLRIEWSESISQRLRIARTTTPRRRVVPEPHSAIWRCPELVDDQLARVLIGPTMSTASCQSYYMREMSEAFMYHHMRRHYAEYPHGLKQEQSDLPQHATPEDIHLASLIPDFPPGRNNVFEIDDELAAYRANDPTVLTRRNASTLARLTRRATNDAVDNKTNYATNDDINDHTDDTPDIDRVVAGNHADHVADARVRVTSTPNATLPPDAVLPPHIYQNMMESMHDTLPDMFNIPGESIDWLQNILTLRTSDMPPFISQRLEALRIVPAVRARVMRLIAEICTHVATVIESGGTGNDALLSFFTERGAMPLLARIPGLLGKPVECIAVLWEVFDLVTQNKPAVSEPTAL
jgi:hypothetical protein